LGSLPLVEEEWLTYAEAADILGCHISTVSKLISSGDLQNRRQDTERRVRAGALRRDDVVRLAEASQGNLPSSMRTSS